MRHSDRGNGGDVIGNYGDALGDAVFGARM